MSSDMPSFLKRIIEEKTKEIKANITAIPLSVIENIIADVTEPARGFYNALTDKIQRSENAVIAELKKASPSKGVIREDFQPIPIAKSLEKNGAACLSVLTDKPFFQGSELYLDTVRGVSSLPILRKDFIIHEYQVLESRAMGADCILLIAACLTHEQLLHLTRMAYDLGMDVLIEVHNLQELDKVAGLPVRMVGINNRDLNTFKVDLSVTSELVAQLPSEILVVTESGVSTRDDVTLMNSVGVKSFLIGETLMRADDPGEKLAELFS